MSEHIPGRCADCDDTALNCVLDSEFDAVELTGPQLEALRDHVRTCPSCRRDLKLARVVKALVHSACCDVKAPTELRSRIIVNFRSVRVTRRES